jgi:single-strand DNA-binding protein
MASFELVGKLHEAFATEQKTESFKVREFVIEEQDGNYPQYIKFQLSQDRCVQLDNYNVGEQVRVFFNLRGRAWSKDGRSGYISTLDCWRLERISGSTQAATPPTATAAPMAPAAATPPPVAPAADGDDLPF